MRFYSKYCPNFSIARLLTAVLCLTGCKYQPTDAQLELWHKEAIARNAQMLAAHANKFQRREWNVAIEGQTATGKSLQLSWQELETLATTHVRTASPFKTARDEGILDYRGVSVSQLLSRTGVAPNVTDVTFVAFDSYRVTVSLADLQRYPIILALEENGKFIPQHKGGPFYLVFPHNQHPELKSKYPDRFWVFYVAHLIVGTEPVRLRVGGDILNLAALDKLPQVTLEATGVSYKNGWPSGKVKLQGVRLRDILAARGVGLPNRSTVVVRGKLQLYRIKHPPRLPAAAIENCDIILATRWGDERQLISAKLGGPLTLAFPEACPTMQGKQNWVTFVEELEVEAPF